MEISVVLIALAAIAVTHWLGGVTAFGSSLLAFPILVWLMDIQTARTILLLLGTAQAYQVFAYTYRHVVWREFGRMVLVAGIGLPIGILAVHHLPEQALLGFLGVVLIVSGVSRARRKGSVDTTPCPAPVLYGLLVLGGIIHGAFVSGGAALIVYAQNKMPEKNRFRGTLSAFWALINTILVGALLIDGADIGSAIPIVVLALPLIILVSWLANRKAKQLSEHAFSKWVSTFLVVGGIITIVRALMPN